MAPNRVVEWPVVNDERGRAIQRRRLRLGIGSVSEFARELKLDRQTIVRAESGQASERTYMLLETWLSEREIEFGMQPEPAADEAAPAAADPVVEFRVGGNFGVDVVVAGPVSNLPELEAAVGRLLDRLRSEVPTSNGAQAG